jgi:hypothetical protein
MHTRRAFLYSAGAAFGAGPLRVTDTKGEKVAVAFNGITILEYRYSKDRPKPYVHPLCLPDGQPVTLDGPRDHIYHRGLMVAWSEVNGFDFWGEENPAPHGQIVHQSFERVRDSPPAEIVAINHWIAEGYYRGDAGVAFFDSPTNPRHPNAFFVMNKPFGYMSAAPTFRAPFDLNTGESIRFTWGVLAFKGKADSAALDRRFQMWAKGERP